MNEREIILTADGILRKAGMDPKWSNLNNLVKNANLLKNHIGGLSKLDRLRIPKLQEFLVEFNKFYDRADRIVLADPMVLYEPAHKVSEEFHSSEAFVRFYMAGNRTSKTQSGYAEHYFVSTGQHRWRKLPPRTKTAPMTSFIVGKAYSKYAPTIFEAKLLAGEQDNELSPIFPPTGKWFYHYDERKKIIQIACPECANAGKGQQCPHPKSRINLYSDEGGWENLMGTQYAMGHFDEHISEEWYEEAKQRLSVVPNSSLIITGTPQFGDEAWEIRKLYKLWEEGAPKNLQRNGKPIVSIHNISQFDAGIVTPDVIYRSMADMDEFEIESRIYGKPAPLARFPVFDRRIIAEMLKSTYEPTNGMLVYEDDVPLQNANNASKFTLKAAESGATSYYKIWEAPQPNTAYVIGVDTAKGLVGPRGNGDKDGDASAASVLKVTSTGIGVQLSLVAQYYGWINPLDYADEVFKLGTWYNQALVVIELTGGYGEATMLRLRQELFYANLFRDENAHAQTDPTIASRFGVETNMRTKPYMVSALQRFIKDKAITVPCKATLREMLSFEQERSEQRLLAPRYRGVGGAKDDRVMSLVIGVSVMAQQTVVDYVSYAAKHQTKVYNDQRWKDLHKELDETKRIEESDTWH